MVDPGATNSFTHGEVIQKLNATTVDNPVMRITLADGSYIDCSTFVPLYLKLCGDLYKSPPGVSKTLHVGYCVLLN